MSPKPFQIAIDGPVAAGCSTTARLLAERLGFLYIDTGAMYRSVALLALRHQLDLANETAVTKLTASAKLELHNPTESEQDGRLTTVLLNGEDVSWEIRKTSVSQGSSVVAQHPQVRKILVKKQQQLAQNQTAIMEGRDIAVRVLPHADLKIFMTASAVVRAKRRLLQAQTKGQDVSFEEVYQQLIERDKRDSERDIDPLKPVSDSLVIDTSDLTINQIISVIIAQVKVKQELKIK